PVVHVLSLHDALPIWPEGPGRRPRHADPVPAVGDHGAAAALDPECDPVAGRARGHHVVGLDDRRTAGGQSGDDGLTGAESALLRGEGRADTAGPAHRAGKRSRRHRGGRSMNSRNALGSAASWFEPQEVTELRRRLPIPYLDIVPVRTDVDGSVEEVGLLLRASGAGRIVRAIVSGRVLVHESLREAISRHIDKDLGPMAMPRIPVSPVPFTVAEYFPTPGVS